MYIIYNFKILEKIFLNILCYNLKFIVDGCDCMLYCFDKCCYFFFWKDVNLMDK